MAKLMIMGAGGMGTALAVAFSQMGHQVWLWGWSAEENAAIRAARENVPLLRGVKIPEAVEIVDTAEAAADTGMASDASATQEDDAANPADDDALHDDEDPQRA